MAQKTDKSFEVQHGKKPNQKLKPYLVQQYLLKNTDEDHAAKTKDIITHLKAYGITADRHSIARDVDALNELFTMAFQRMSKLEYFFETFLDEVDKYKKEFRLVFQVTSSPIYGERMRNKAEEFKFMYEKYISMLSEMLGCDIEVMTSFVYMIMALLVDYVMWEDLPTSKMQLESLYKLMKSSCKKQKFNS